MGGEKMEGEEEEEGEKEELWDPKMLVCQFVTKAVCSYVIDWQTVRAQCPQGHQATATQSHSFFIFYF